MPTPIQVRICNSGVCSKYVATRIKLVTILLIDCVHAVQMAHPVSHVSLSLLYKSAGNMMRTVDGKLCILDFGLMTEITEDQRYGCIEAIAHLLNRDYTEIGQDFINLDFIPKGTDTSSIVPALTKVFDVALAGGGAKSINFQELAADLAQITFDYPFRIPPYFALVIRAISVLEGIALVGNPNFAIIDEAFPYIARRLLTDRSPRLRKALRYMVYGRDGEFDAENLIDLLQALEKFSAIRDDGDGSAYKVDGVRGSKAVGSAGDFSGSQKVDLTARENALNAANVNGGAPLAMATNADGDAAVDPENDERTVREALLFFFGSEGDVFREFMLEEVVNVVDASSRGAVQELTRSLGLGNLPVPSFFKAINPDLTDQDRRVSLLCFAMQCVHRRR
jgi:aarF domain-containing kinase